MCLKTFAFEVNQRADHIRDVIEPVIPKPVRAVGSGS